MKQKLIMWRSLLLTLVVVSHGLVAFGQGKISFINDASRAVYYLPGSPCNSGYLLTNPAPNGVTIMVDLYGGVDAGSMTFQTTTPLFTSPGLFGPVNFVSTNLAGGTTYTMQVKVRDARYASAEASQSSASYWGYSPIFTFRPSSTIAYNSIVNSGGTALSTWASGAIQVGTSIPWDSSPFLFSSPQGGFHIEGSNVTLSVNCQGASPLSFQWRKNGSVIVVGNSSALSLTNVTSADTGSYDVVVTNCLGSVTSSVAVVQVLPPNTPFVLVNKKIVIGTVTSSGPASISITGGFPGGTIVYTLDGSPPIGGSTRYTGAFSISNSCNLRAMSLSSDLTQSAEAPPINVLVSYSLSTSVSGGGTLNRDPSSNSYLSGTVVGLTASASTNWVFNHWTGDVIGTSNPASITMNGNRGVQAVFTPTAFPLTLSTLAGGSVTADGLHISPNTYYPTGSTVQLQATPIPGWTFMNWRGTVTNTSNPFNLLMTQVQNVEAVFGTVVTTNIAGEGTVVMSVTNPVPYGTRLTNTAVPRPGNYLVTWSGAVSGTNNPVTFTVNYTTPTVGALFALSPGAKGQLKNPRKSGADFVSDLSGAALRSYQIQYSTNLVDWSNLVVLTNVTGTVSFTNATGDMNRYYRAMLLP